MYAPDFTELVPEHWRERLGWSSLTGAQQAALGEFALHMFSLGSTKVDDIDEVKYDGRLVILNDGSRWEVAEYDAHTVDMWGSFTKVAIIDDVMYNLGDAEHVDVVEEIV